MRQTKRRQLPLKPLLDRLRKIVRRLLDRVLRAALSPLRPSSSAGSPPRPLDDWWAKVKGGGPPEHWLAMLNERLGEDGYPFDLSFPIGQSAPWPGDHAADSQVAGLTAESQQPDQEIASPAGRRRPHDDGTLSAHATVEPRRTDTMRTTPRNSPQRLRVHPESTQPGQNSHGANSHAAPAPRPAAPVRRPAMRVHAAPEADPDAWRERAIRSEAVQPRRPATMPAPRAHHDGESVEWEPVSVVDMPSLPTPRRAAQFPHRLPMPDGQGETRTSQRSGGTERGQRMPRDERPPLLPAWNAPMMRTVSEANPSSSEMRSETHPQNHTFPSLPAARTARSSGKSLRAAATQRKPGFTEAEPLRMDAGNLPAWPSLPNELPDEDEGRREWRDRDDLARLEREQRGVE